MKEQEIREGDIVEIDYIDELTEERVSEGKALVMWKGFNHQPLIHKLDAKRTIWSGYDSIARVVGHVDIERYMEDAIALEQEPCEDCISRQAVLNLINADWKYEGLESDVENLPSVTPQPKTAHWIHFANSDDCSGCGWSTGKYISPSDYCPKCGAKMESESVSK